ncbi:MAG: PilZ domain-containing protein [Desulfobacterota bacterium]|nr:PilZ domain-containing protein [Thermodesulfobacteriota bacterium]
MDERRKFQRYPVSLEAIVQDSDGKQQHCRVSDVSREGVRLLLREHIPFRQTINLRILLPQPHEAVTALMSVRWTRPLDGNDLFTSAAGGDIRCDGKDKDRLIAYVESLHRTA